MRSYTHHHQHYGGIDLHARSRSGCLPAQAGTIGVHKKRPAPPEAFFRVMAPDRDEGVVAVECIVTW
jgi:hypothetical protein